MLSHIDIGKAVAEIASKKDGYKNKTMDELMVMIAKVLGKQPSPNAVRTIMKSCGISIKESGPKIKELERRIEQLETILRDQLGVQLRSCNNGVPLTK